MFKEIYHHNRETTYKSFETDIEYSSPFRGGFSWPKPVSAFLCVIGRQADSGILRVLAEYEEGDLSSLARLCGTLRGVPYHISVWTAQKEADYKSYEDALDKFAKDDGLSINLNHPSMAWNLNLAIQIIRGKMRQNRLLLPKGGILQKQIEKINRETSLTEPEKMTVYSPLLVLSSLIFEFDSLSEEDDEDFPRDKWAEDFKDSGYSGSFMGA
jgi:hypothetical protein